MMNVVFDHQIFVAQERGGISRYICSLAEQLATLPDTRVLIATLLHRNDHLDGVGRAIRPRAVRQPFRSARFASAVNGALGGSVLQRFRPDVIHETFYSRRGVHAPGALRVLTLHDMIHERYPELFKDASAVSDAKRRAVERADLVICVSRSSEADLLSHMPQAAAKTVVVHHGSSLVSDAALSVRRGGHAAPYLLYVGGRGGYKNFHAFLVGLSRSRYRADVEVLCVGGGELTAEEQRRILSLGLDASRVRQITVGDSGLAALYRDAVALVYPSRYEGFGLPPLEAMSLGCPVVCSNSSSLPEVVGDAAELFDPEDAEDITSALDRVLGSDERRRTLALMGLKRSRRFSWERCARETRAAYAQTMARRA